MTIRNPSSIRPYQHVLEPVYAYLMICARQYEDKTLAGSYNIGPDENDCITTQELVETFNRFYDGKLKFSIRPDDGPHEANLLKLDCSKAKSVFGWKPRWNVHQAIEKVTEWSKSWLAGEDMSAFTEKQIKEFLSLN